jgi:hypothetical protein
MRPRFCSREAIGPPNCRRCAALWPPAEDCSFGSSDLVLALEPVVSI